jgi:DNA helicase-2/ATP-dependent DNA helicase PcrA
LDRFRLMRDHGQESLFQNHNFGEKGEKNEIRGFVNLIESLREAMFTKGGLSQKVKAMTESINYWGYLVGEYSKGDKEEKKARWKYANIGYLIGMIERWEKDPDNLDPSLYAYLNRISLLSRNENDEEAKGKVNLMTIHASKGLEFPVVFIAGAEDGIIPHERSLEDGLGDESFNPLEEERRLFYVAITRARDKLYISSCRQRKRLQTTTDRSPSPFLAEIPSRLITFHETVPKAAAEEAVTAEDFFSRMKARFGTS